MEEEKEVAEEKEGDEEEEGLHLITGASTVDSQDLPIMHWEDLSQRIAELEKQEQERRERSKVSRADTSDVVSQKTPSPMILSTILMECFRLCADVRGCIL